MIRSDNYNNRLYDFINNRIDLILNNPYITGMGYGFKSINNKTTNIPALVFLVQNKVSLSEIHPYYQIPKIINGVVTDVLESKIQVLCRNEKRPAYAGLSVANSLNEKIHGTITYAVTNSEKNKDLYILSCSHVLSSKFDTGKPLTDVMQPAKRFGGIPTEIGKKNGSSIGYLEDFTNLQWATEKKALDPNNPIEIDAAIAYVGPNTKETRDSLLAPYFKVGREQQAVSILKTDETKVGDEIWTITANTDKRKYAVVKLTDVVQAATLDNKFLLYNKQVFITKTNESQNFILGDSGAFVIRNTPENIGLGMIVSSNGDQALYTPIKKILNKFKVELVKPDLPK